MKLKRTVIFKIPKETWKETHGDGGTQTEDFVANLKHGNFDNKLQRLVFADGVGLFSITNRFLFVSGRSGTLAF